ncbi:MAG: hypothetical protein F6K28_48280 [Microcoleus sp. SIO2G3]|nr:hypothetical protein [Microcoleus sp. SIO2G3]
MLKLPQETPTQWQNALTGQTVEGEGVIALASALEHFPVALLLSEA